MNDSYLYIIVALLPLAALMLTVQVNPYHALVVRGILGAVAALVYAVLGAADVALTEALVGTMLAITLNAVAVRSSLVMRLGILEDKLLDAEEKIKQKSHDCLFASLVNDLRTVANKHHLRLELVPYADPLSLHQALMEKEIHAVCVERSPHSESRLPKDSQPYQTTTRIRRLYEIFQAGLSPSATCLTYVTTSDSGEKH